MNFRIWKTPRIQCEYWYYQFWFGFELWHTVQDGDFGGEAAPVHAGRVYEYQKR